MKQYWVENHFAMGGSIVAKVEGWKAKRSELPEIEIVKLLHNTGEFSTWSDGDVTMVSRDDLKDERESVRFIFEELKYL